MTVHHVRDVRVTQTRLGEKLFAIDLPRRNDELDGHTLDGFCWCQPLIEYDPTGVSSDRLYIHRRSLDSPHIEPA